MLYMSEETSFSFFSWFLNAVWNDLITRYFGLFFGDALEFFLQNLYFLFLDM